ncbi:class I SAM-dependent methyltransferase [Candidatus Saccharibacteria bacterium]|nr:class I SAM-dependent methyltransferase [Candidatus Saccharibacteria bacterium]
MDHYETTSKKSYDKRAAGYDSDRTGKFTQNYKELLLEVIGKTYNIKPGDKVLDVACGTGTLLKMLGDRYKIDGYGVDISNNMVKVAQQKNPSFHFTVATASDLSIAKDNSISLITVSSAYHHFPDTGKFLREAYHVLKPGGAIFIAEPYLPTLLRPLILFILTHFSTSGDKMIYTPQQINAAFRKNGLQPQPTTIKNHIQICHAVK